MEHFVEENIEWIALVVLALLALLGGVRYLFSEPKKDPWGDGSELQ